MFLVGVFTFRLVLTFPVTVKSLALGVILFIESLLTYSFMRSATLTSYAGFLGKLITYKELYIEIVMLVLWTILTRDFIGLLMPLRMGKAKISSVFKRIRESSVMLREEFMTLKYKIFSHYNEQPLPYLMLNPDSNPTKLTDALLSPASELTSY